MFYFFESNEKIAPFANIRMEYTNVLMNNKLENDFYHLRSKDSVFFTTVNYT
jgi:hypothetical protein